MFNYSLTNPFASSNVFIIGAVTDYKPVSLSDKITLKLGNGIHYINYIVDDVLTYCIDKLHKMRQSGEISNYIIISDGILNNDFVTESYKIGDIEPFINAYPNTMVDNNIKRPAKIAIIKQKYKHTMTPFIVSENIKYITNTLDNQTTHNLQKHKFTNIVKTDLADNKWY